MWQNLVKRAHSFIMCIIKKKSFKPLLHVEEYTNQRPEKKAINIVPSCKKCWVLVFLVDYQKAQDKKGLRDD